RGRVKVVADERVTPTYTQAVARQLAALLRSNQYGLFHATCQGDCSWFEFAEAIFRLSQLAVIVERASAADFPKKVRRPTYSVLQNAALAAQGLDVMPHWLDALDTYLSGVKAPQATLQRPTYESRSLVV